MGGVHKVKVNMDHLRAQMTGALNRLGSELLYQIPVMKPNEQEALLDIYNDLAMYVGAINCLYTEDEMFNDISDQLEIMNLAERLEES